MTDFVYTTGLVQRFSISSGTACAWVGPGPADVEVFVLFKDPPPNNPFSLVDFPDRVIDVLTSAMLDGREVKIMHPQDTAFISDVTIEPS